MGVELSALVVLVVRRLVAIELVLETLDVQVVIVIIKQPRHQVAKLCELQLRR